MKNELFDVQLASECVKSFHTATNIPTSISLIDNTVVVSYGNTCKNCSICQMLCLKSEKCNDFHIYGLEQARRFGGKYIYFCQGGLNFIISPIVDQNTPVAFAKAGPFLMVDKNDYVNLDLVQHFGISNEDLESNKDFIDNVPFIAPEKVNDFSTLLFMSIGFINNINICNNIINNQKANEIQDYIGEVIQSIKGDEDEDSSALNYPFKKEHELLRHISNGEREESNAILNDLLGYIFFYSSGDLEVIKARIYELIILISRTAIDKGADPIYIFELNRKYSSELSNFKTIDELCFWFSNIIKDIMDLLFSFVDVKHVDVIKKSVDYIRKNFSNKITLEQVAAHIFLSPSYFSKIFKDEMNCNFNYYLNFVRVEKAKVLLIKDNIKLVDVSLMVGFEDQSYFSKVFKKLVGVSPGKYRESGGKVIIKK